MLSLRLYYLFRKNYSENRKKILKLDFTLSYLRFFWICSSFNNTTNLLKLFLFFMYNYTFFHVQKCFIGLPKKFYLFTDFSLNFLLISILFSLNYLNLIIILQIQQSNRKTIWIKSRSKFLYGLYFITVLLIAIILTSLHTYNLLLQ